MKMRGAVFLIILLSVELSSLSPGIVQAGNRNRDVEISLKSLFQLPTVLDRKFTEGIASDPVVIARKTTARKTAADIKGFLQLFERDSMLGAGYADRSRWELVIESPYETADPRFRKLAAAILMRDVFTDVFPIGEKQAMILKMPQKMASEMVNDPWRDADPRDRLIRYGISWILGDPAQDDERAALWWRVRMNPGPLLGLEAQTNHTRFLLSFLVTGYEGSSLTPGDAGHTTTGLLALDDDTTNDFIVNPGGKRIEGRKKPLNMIRVHNLWDWMENQVAGRHLDLKIHVHPMTEAQANALELIAGESDGYHWGNFDLLSNNCAHGAVNILASLFPLGDEPEVHGLISTPRAVFHAMERALPVLGEVSVPKSPRPADFQKTPDGESPQLAAEQRKKTRAYLALEAWRSTRSLTAKNLME